MAHGETGPRQDARDRRSCPGTHTNGELFSISAVQSFLPSQGPREHVFETVHNRPDGFSSHAHARMRARARARTRTQPVTETAARQRKQLGARNYGFVRGTKRTSGRGYRRQTWKLAGPTRAAPLALGRDRKLLLDRIEIFILIFHNDELNVGLELGWMKIVRLCEAFHWASQILFYSHILFYLFYFNWVINTQYINWVFKSFGQFLEFTVGIE